MDSLHDSRPHYAILHIFLLVIKTAIFFNMNTYFYRTLRGLEHRLNHGLLRVLDCVAILLTSCTYSESQNLFAYLT